MSGKINPPQAAPPFRKRSSLPASLALVGLLSAGTFGIGSFQSRQASRQAQTADLIHQLSRQSLWLYGAAGRRPHKEWQPVFAALEADWSSLAAAAPATAKPLDGDWHSVNKSLQSQGRLGWTTADRFSEAAEAQASRLAQNAQHQKALAGRLIPAGAGGLLLCLLGSLGLLRRQRLTQFQTTQSYLAAERTVWEKQRSVFDAQRDQLIAELQQAQQHKAELDTLRQHGSRQFEEFFRTLPVACFCVAASGKIVRWNSACEALYGRAADDVLDKLLWETIVPSGERDRVKAQLARVLSGESLAEIDRRDQNAKGAPIDVRCSLAPLRDAAGQIIGCLSANLALAEPHPFEPQIESQSPALQEMQALLNAQQEEIKTLRVQQETATPAAPSPESETLLTDRRNLRDSVTGLYTHGDFQEHIQSEFGRMARYHTPSSLVLIDVDDFGRYNEALGYRAGDQALRDIADLLNTKVRSVDIVARYGADEFAILLPETGRAGALIAAERFRAGIAGLAWDGKPLTASVSIAVLTPDLLHPQAFVAKAVAALRGSEGSGPNRTVCADDPPFEETGAVLQSASGHK